jgi:hypothetical protein
MNSAVAKGKGHHRNHPQLMVRKGVMVWMCGSPPLFRWPIM